MAAMRLLALTFTLLLVAIQYPLWLGKGGWLRVWELERQLGVQQQANQRQLQRNAALEGEVGDLQKGTGAVEERARYELGMVRPDEVFVQINPAPDLATPDELRGGTPGREARSDEVQTADARGPRWEGSARLRNNR